MPSTKKPAAAGKPVRKAAVRATGAKKPAKRAAPGKRADLGAASPVEAAQQVPEEVPERRAAEPRSRKAAGPTITIEQYASGIACPKRQKRVLRSLGLRHPRHQVVRPDNPAVRGMVDTIPHLVRIVEGERGA